MTGKIALVTIITDNLPGLVGFCRVVLGVKIKVEVDDYVEFESTDVRFSICARNEAK